MVGRAGNTGAFIYAAIPQRTGRTSTLCGTFRSRRPRRTGLTFTAPLIMVFFTFVATLAIFIPHGTRITGRGFRVQGIVKGKDHFVFAIFIITRPFGDSIDVNHKRLFPIQGHNTFANTFINRIQGVSL